MAADKGLVSREMNTSVGMLGRWETDAVIKKWDSALIGPNNVIKEETEQQDLNREDEVCGPKKRTKAKAKKWKFQAMVRTKMSEVEVGPISLKRPVEGTMISSRRTKKAMVRSPNVTRVNQIRSSSLSKKLKLLWEDAVQKVMEF